MLNPGTTLARRYTEPFEMSDFLDIALVQSPKVTSWDEFHRDLRDLDIRERSYAFDAVDMSQTTDIIMSVIEEYVDTNCIVTSQRRKILVDQYQKAMPRQDDLITTWFLLDMWALDEKAFNMLKMVQSQRLTNYEVLRKIMSQGVPLYKPSKFSWRKFWALCAIEMTASRKHFCL